MIADETVHHYQLAVLSYIFLVKAEMIHLYDGVDFPGYRPNCKKKKDYFNQTECNDKVLECFYSKIDQILLL